MNCDIIYLCGFMTSGKSTIGPIVANVLGWNFYDLDKVIEENEKRAIVDIFKTEGEEYFRKIENETLRKLSQNKKTLVSLGGGTIAAEKNLKIMKDTGLIIYLKASPEMIYKRIKNKIDRPAFRDMVLEEKSEDEFILKIKNMLKDREPYYMMCDLIIDTNDTPVGITVDKLVKKIKNLRNDKSTG